MKESRFQINRPGFISKYQRDRKKKEKKYTLRCHQTVNDDKYSMDRSSPEVLKDASQPPTGNTTKK